VPVLGGEVFGGFLGGRGHGVFGRTGTPGGRGFGPGAKQMGSGGGPLGVGPGGRAWPAGGARGAGQLGPAHGFTTTGRAARRDGANSGLFSSAGFG